MKLILISKQLSTETDSATLISMLRANLDLKSESFHLIYPKEDSYKVEQIKEFNINIAKKNNVGQAEGDIFVFMRCEVMSPICQNALLKTLEETHKSIILITSNLNTLLHTIASRMQTKFIIDNPSEILDSQEISLDSIPALSKLPRDEVRKLLEVKLNQFPENYLEILKLDKAIQKLNANCKIEAILFELIG